MSDQTELLRLLRLAWISDHVTADDCKKIDTLLAATAEDVAAVVDEPVGYMTQCLRGDRVGVVEQAEGPDSVVNLQYWTPAFPVYRHPQRQMVLPERKEPTQDEPYMTEASHGFNACLDEISRLNK
jgi:hypothetical protein